MKLPQWILSTFGESRTRGQAAPIERLHIRNLTRQTVLATSLEVADTSAKRNKGLLGRKELAFGEGLWILPCQSVHTFGMKFSIDLVYLDRKKRIRKVSTNVGPWRVSVCLSAHSVMELPSGTIHETGSRPGDVVEFTSSKSSIDQCGQVSPEP